MISHAGMKVASIEEKKTTHVKVFVKNFSNKKIVIEIDKITSMLMTKQWSH